MNPPDLAEVRARLRRLERRNRLIGALRALAGAASIAAMNRSITTASVVV